MSSNYLQGQAISNLSYQAYRLVIPIYQIQQTKLHFRKQENKYHPTVAKTTSAIYPSQSYFLEDVNHDTKIQIFHSQQSNCKKNQLDSISFANTNTSTSYTGTPTYALQLCLDLCDGLGSLEIDGDAFYIIQYKYMDKVQEQQIQDQLILPNSTFVVFWSLISSILVFTYFGVAVFEISFQTVINREFLNKSYFAAILFVYCVVDTLIFTNIGIIVDGRLINNRYKNFLNYVKTYLVYTDVIVLVVLIARIIIGTIDESKHDYNIVESCLDLVIILKFLNIRQYQKILKYYYFNEWSILVFEFLKNLILLTIVCHVVGCGFFLIDVSLYEAKWYGNADSGYYWTFSAPAVANITNQQGQTGLYYAPLNEQYLYSIYFAIVTLSTIAYGDITPLNPTEVAYILLVLAFLLMLYIYIFTQIYEAVNWFSRRSRSIKQQKYKLAKFMQRFNISSKLSGNIVSHFQYREQKYKKTDKEIFINDLSVKLARKYQSTPFKNQTKQFIPKFMKRMQIQLSIFYESLSQKFYNPEEQFSPIQISNQNVQRIMYFIPQNCQVYRKIQTGTSIITEKAKKRAWLGLNSFFTSQHDEKQKWTVSSPMELNAINFSDFINLIRNEQRHYQKFLEECHTSMCRGEYMQQRNKCLICWGGYHSSQNCVMHRPEIKRKDRIFLLRSFTLGQLQHLIKIKPRSKFTRSTKKHKKMIKFPPLNFPPEEKSTQTEHLDQKLFVKFKRIFVVRQRQSVANWLYYIPNFNISNYENQKQQKKLALVK